MSMFRFKTFDGLFFFFFADMLFYYPLPFSVQCELDSFSNGDFPSDTSCQETLVQPQVYQDFYFGYFINKNNLTFKNDGNETYLFISFTLETRSEEHTSELQS